MNFVSWSQILSIDESQSIRLGAANFFKRDESEFAPTSRWPRQQRGNKPNPGIAGEAAEKRRESSGGRPEKSLFLAGNPQCDKKIFILPNFRHFNLRSFTDIGYIRSGPGFFTMKMG